MNATFLSNTWEKMSETRFLGVRPDLGAEVYDFIEVVKEEIPISETETETSFSINIYTVDLKDYSYSEIVDCISQYEFDSLTGVREVYGDGYMKVVADWLYMDVKAIDKQIKGGLNQNEAISRFKDCFGILVEF